MEDNSAGIGLVDVEIVGRFKNARMFFYEEEIAIEMCVHADVLVRVLVKKMREVKLEQGCPWASDAVLICAATRQSMAPSQAVVNLEKNVMRTGVALMGKPYYGLNIRLPEFAISIL